MCYFIYVFNTAFTIFISNFAQSVLNSISALFEIVFRTLTIVDRIKPGYGRA